MAPNLTVWTPANIFEARDRAVRFRDGRMAGVRLYPDGWAIAEHDGLDVWTACRLLNDRGAEPAYPENRQCPRCGGRGVLEPSGFCSFVCKDLYEAFCEAVSRYDY